MIKRKIARIVLMLTMSCTMSVGLSACSTSSIESTTEEPTASQGETEVVETEETTTAVDESAVAGNEEDDCPYELFAYDLPDGYKKPTDQPGEIHEETYTTYLYDENGEKGEEITATLYVYTPHGYDESKQYNIVYLMHGIGDDEGYWLGAGDYAEGGDKYSKSTAKYTTNVFEHMIEDDLCEESILVTPTFMDQFADDDVYADDSTSKLIKFSYQFKNDIIPYVEAKYATYAGGDVSEENLIATRDHRAYAGLSMGSMTGFQAIWMNCVEYVSYIGNFSGCDAQGTGIAEQVAETLNSKYSDYDIKYWYNGNGTIDSVHDDHVEGYAIIMGACADKFTEGEDYVNGQNAIFVDKPGKGHAYNSWIVDFYNIMNVFFKVD